MKRNRAQRFSIRKHAVGAASVLLGTVVLGIGAVQAAQIIPVLDGVAQEAIETGDAQSDIDTTIEVEKDNKAAEGYEFAGSRLENGVTYLDFVTPAAKANYTIVVKVNGTEVSNETHTVDAARAEELVADAVATFSEDGKYSHVNHYNENVTPDGATVVVELETTKRAYKIIDADGVEEAADFTTSELTDTKWAELLASFVEGRTTDEQELDEEASYFDEENQVSVIVFKKKEVATQDFKFVIVENGETSTLEFPALAPAQFGEIVGDKLEEYKAAGYSIDEFNTVNTTTTLVVSKTEAPVLDSFTLVLVENGATSTLEFPALTPAQFGEIVGDKLEEYKAAGYSIDEFNTVNTTTRLVVSKMEAPVVEETELYSAVAGEANISPAAYTLAQFTGEILPVWIEQYGTKFTVVKNDEGVNVYTFEVTETPAPVVEETELYSAVAGEENISPTAYTLAQFTGEILPVWIEQYGTKFSVVKNDEGVNVYTFEVTETPAPVVEETELYSAVAGEANISPTAYTLAQFTGEILPVWIEQYGTKFSVVKNDEGVNVYTFEVTETPAPVAESFLRRFVAITTDGTVKASVDTTAMTEETFNILLEDYIDQYGTNFVFTNEGDVQVVTFTVEEGKLVEPAEEDELPKGEVPAPSTAPSTEPSTAPSTEPSTAPSTEPSTEPSTAPSTEPSSSSTSSSSQLVLKPVENTQVLPKTGDSTSTNAVVAGLGLLVAGLGFGLARKKKED